MEEKIDQILKNQSTIFVALASLYCDEKEDIELLNQISSRQNEMIFLLNSTKEPTIAKKTEDALWRDSE